MIQPVATARLTASQAFHHPVLSPAPPSDMPTPPFVRTAAGYAPKPAAKEPKKRRTRKAVVSQLVETEPTEEPTLKTIKSNRNLQKVAAEHERTEAIRRPASALALRCEHNVTPDERKDIKEKLLGAAKDQRAAEPAIPKKGRHVRIVSEGAISVKEFERSLVEDDKRQKEAQKTEGEPAVIFEYDWR